MVVIKTQMDDKRLFYNHKFPALSTIEMLRMHIINHLSARNYQKSESSILNEERITN